VIGARSAVANGRPGTINIRKGKIKMAHTIGNASWNFTGKTDLKGIDAAYITDADAPPTVEISPEKMEKFDRRHRALLKILAHDLSAAATDVEELGYLSNKMTELLYNAICTAVEVDANAA
jgi:hypothetical protein